MNPDIREDLSSAGTYAIAKPAAAAHFVPRRRALFLLAGLLLVAMISTARAQVTPGLYLVEGNPACAGLYQGTVVNGPAADLWDLGPLYGFKYDTTPTDGVVSTFVDNGDWFITNGPQDPNNSVVIFNVNLLDGAGIQFDWRASLGMDAVIVKGGAGSHAYVYTPEAFGGTDLVAPENFAISHVEFCYDYELAVEKTAAGTFDRTIDWTITKDVSPESHSLFIGESDTSEYNVSVIKTVTEDNYRVEGTITITNPAPIAVDVFVEDTMNGVTASVDCGEGTGGSATVPASGSLTCTYAATEADGLNGSESLNTATVNSPTDDIGGGVAAAPIEYVATSLGEPESITVTDSNGLFWTVSDDATWQYANEFTCPADPSFYIDGSYSFIVDNTASIEDTGDSDSEAVAVNCYAPILAKTAETAYTRTYDWTITKDVVSPSYTGFFGDAFIATYTVEVDRTVTESDFQVSGVITVQNPNPTDAMLITLSDSVGGAPASLSCGGTLVVLPGEQETCAYTVAVSDKTDGLNTANGTFNGIGFSASAAFTFGEPTTVVGDPVVRIEDTNGLGWDAAGDDLFVYQRTFDCPSDPGVYIDGIYSAFFPNTATILETQQFDEAGVSLTCYVPARARVVKLTTEGPEDIGQFPFTFELYAPDGGLVESRTLEGAGDLVFDAELRTEGTWTVVETLPTGWISETPLSCTFDVDFPASAGQVFACTFDNTEQSRVEVLKLTNGVVNDALAWTFGLYVGPDGFGGPPIGSDSTPPAYLDFDSANLDAYGTYTLCELGVPAGWSTFWQVDTTGDDVADTTVLPYNPNADDEPPEDLGNRCVDFGAGTPFPLLPGEKLVFSVDNQAPGGAPRTPGYWKNWNRCTNGGQQFTADANGGWEQGFWLLEDVLDPAIGGGIAWDDILDDDYVFPIQSCDEAALLLDKREVDSGRKAASDPLINLATHLLAAQLNFGAGACVTQEVLDTALTAEAVLDEYDFDGTARLLKKNDRDAAQVPLELAAYLDRYNNGEFCGDGLE